MSIIYKFNLFSYLLVVISYTYIVNFFAAYLNVFSSIKVVRYVLFKRFLVRQFTTLLIKLSPKMNCHIVFV